MPMIELALDEMTQGGNSNASDWKALITHSNREQIWIDAIKRREHLDKFCYFAVT
ncbi:hypothetical protein [Vibrio nigripulchritudo]|nr:hypothetical protein [Vibrio nigripulchritudo]